MQSRAGHFRRIDDPGIHHVDPLAGGGVKSDSFVFFLQPFDDDRPFETGVLGDLANRLFQRPFDNVDTCRLIPCRLYTFDSRNDVDERRSTTGHEFLLLQPPEWS